MGGAASAAAGASVGSQGFPVDGASAVVGGSAGGAGGAVSSTTGADASGSLVPHDMQNFESSEFSVVHSGQRISGSRL